MAAKADIEQDNAGAPRHSHHSSFGAFTRYLLAPRLENRYHRDTVYGELAKNYTEHFDEAVSLHEILRATKEVFPKLPEDESWLLSYVERVVDRTSMFHEGRFDDILMALGRISRESGESDAFYLSVIAMVVEKLSMQVQRLAENRRREDQRASVFHYVRC